MEFEEFLAARMPALLRFATVVAGEAGAAEELVLDALVRAGRRWRRIRGDGVEDQVKGLIARAYLRRRRSAGDLVGAVLRRPKVPAETSQAAGEVLEAVGSAEDTRVRQRAEWARRWSAGAEADEALEREALNVRERVERLAARQRVVLGLWCYEGMGPGEIAAALGWPMRMVRMEFSAGMRVLEPYRAEDVRPVLEGLAAEAPGPDGVKGRLGPARHADRRRRRIVGGSVAVVLIVGATADYVVTHPSEPRAVIGPVSTVTYDYGPGWLPDGFSEVIRGTGPDGVSRTWAMGGWQRGPTSLRLILTVTDRWSGPGQTGVDQWLATKDEGVAVQINGHEARETSDSDHLCSVVWLETPERMITVWGVSASGECETVLRMARSVRPVRGVTARQPLRTAEDVMGPDGLAEVIQNRQGCTAALTMYPAGEQGPIIAELRDDGFPKKGTSFRLGGRRARYYTAVLDWSRPPYYLDGPGVAVDLGAGRTLIVAGQSFDPGVTPPAPGTSRATLERIARGVSAGPIGSCSWT